MDRRTERTIGLVRGLISGELVLLSQTHNISEFGNGEITAHFAIRTLLGERTPKAQAMTIRDVIAGMSEEQKTVMYTLIGLAATDRGFIPGIKKVIFNDPCTIVLWQDGTKAVVKCGENDIYDPEKGLALAISKKALGNKGSYYDEFKKWLPEKKDDGAGLSEEEMRTIKIAINNLRKAFLGQVNVQFNDNTLNITADGGD